jgi:hydrogenase maturation protein HypF
MLPSSPLQRGLLDCVGGPIVATSGNRSGEPICADNQVARQRLRGIADLFLFHDRNIVHPCDDAILQIVAGSPLLRRLGRGYAPVTIERRAISDEPVFGFGGLFKSTVAIGRGDTIVISPYHGSAECPEVADRRERFIELVAPIGSFNKGKPQLIASDLHPELREYIPAHAISHPVQHHRAHGWSVVGEHGIRPPVCAVVFDGSGYSPDGTIWGGEWLVLSDGSEERRLSLKPFFLIGGDSASKLPERVAAALWYQWLGAEAFGSTVWGRLEDSAFLSKLISAGSHCTLTSSVGRLFDGVSSVLGLCHHNTFEGEAAMMLEGEALCAHFPDCCNGFYPVRFSESTVDVVPLIAAIDQDMRDGYPRPTIAMRFHRSVIEMIVQGAQQIGIGQVLLTGGCFQNAVLLSGAIARLRESGFTPYWQRTIPCSDEGLSVGQVVVAAGALRNGLHV